MSSLFCCKKTIEKVLSTNELIQKSCIDIKIKVVVFSDFFVYLFHEKSTVFSHYVYICDKLTAE